MPGYVETGLNFVGVEECAAGHLLAAQKGKIGERYLLGGENLTLKAMLEMLSKLTGLPAPRLKIPHGLALGVAYANTVFSRLMGREPGIPIEGVKIARHMMFVDCSRAPRELGFKAGPVSAALERAVRWYEANGYIAKGRVKRMARAAAPKKCRRPSQPGPHFRRHGRADAHPGHVRGRRRIRPLAQTSGIPEAEGKCESFLRGNRFVRNADRQPHRVGIPYRNGNEVLRF